MKLKPLHILSVVILFSVLFGLTYLFTINTVNMKSEIIVTVKNGSGARQIANVLKENHIIKSRIAFINFIKKNNAAKDLRPGTYKFGPGKVTFDDILAKLLQGTLEESISVTIPEGYTVSQIAELFESKGLTTKQAFLDYSGSLEIPFDYIQKGTDYHQLEGFLFPDTYSIPISWKEKEIINMLLNQFDKNWSDKFSERAKELDLTPKEIITIASLIEREAKVPYERATISSVIHNRLKTGMLLQIDATIQYVLEKQKARILYKDLEIESPYNTYKYAGLPPTPIATPGISCIEAALYPEITQYYYYRAKSSGNGEHYFSKTFEEHKNYAGK